MLQEELEVKVERSVEILDNIIREMSDRIIGQEKLIKNLMIVLICGQHVLIEGVPGVAKTLTVKTLSSLVGGGYGRIQFTPDLLPADIIGTQIYSPQHEDFFPKKGPIFTNIILADEINRSPAKVQSALLEAMEERQVTIGEDTFDLDLPFMVMATQNPIDQDGTYPLPEAQVDRFMMKLIVNYPQKDHELQILRRRGKKNIDDSIKPVASFDDILQISKLIDEIYIDVSLEEYIVDIVQCTRHSDFYDSKMKDYIDYGVSPRATINLVLASKANALMSGRTYVIPNDVIEVSKPILRHRLVLSYEALAKEINSDEIIDSIIKIIPIP
ncbi:AAA family ATPase [Spirochaeta cellobiosiphila]|uniref:AAA family ATPase n=1 Tax=Spirochaeta cellobiosiphila TaxID=504483 RepID=UPI0003F4ACEA|nr:AAA family ATPase [Spirochaeta cellobiosiphila]